MVVVVALASVAVACSKKAEPVATDKVADKVADKPADKPATPKGACSYLTEAEASTALGQPSEYRSNDGGSNCVIDPVAEPSEKTSVVDFTVVVGGDAKSYDSFAKTAKPLDGVGDKAAIDATPLMATVATVKGANLVKFTVSGPRPPTRWRSRPSPRPCSSTCDLARLADQGVWAQPVAAYVASVQEILEPDQPDRASMVRALRDLEAARARVERDARNVHDVTRQKLVGELLPVLDNLDRTIRAARDSRDAPAVLEGAQLVRAQLETVLRGYGVARIDVAGARFDPAIHDAISVIGVRDPAQHAMVIDQIEPGYRFGDTLLRPAKVVVGRALV